MSSNESHSREPGEDSQELSSTESASENKSVGDKAEAAYQSFVRQRRYYLWITVALYLLAIVVLAVVFWRGYRSIQEKFDSIAKNLEQIKADTEKRFVAADRASNLTWEAIEEMGEKVSKGDKDADSFSKVVLGALRSHQAAVEDYERRLRELENFQTSANSSWRQAVNGVQDKLDGFKNNPQALWHINSGLIRELRKEVDRLNNLSGILDAPWVQNSSDITTLKSTVITNPLPWEQVRKDITELNIGERSKLGILKGKVDNLENLLKDEGTLRTDIGKIPRIDEDVKKLRKKLDEQLVEEVTKIVKNLQDNAAREATNQASPSPTPKPGGNNN